MSNLFITLVAVPIPPDSVTLATKCACVSGGVFWYGDVCDVRETEQKPGTVLRLRLNREDTTRQPRQARRPAVVQGCATHM